MIQVLSAILAMVVGILMAYFVLVSFINQKAEIYVHRLSISHVRAFDFVYRIYTAMPKSEVKEFEKLDFFRLIEKYAVQWDVSFKIALDTLLEYYGTSEFKDEIAILDAIEFKDWYNYGQLEEALNVER